jgi:hypothetical protein
MSQEPSATRPDPTDRPIPLWPEGALALAAGLVLLAIGLKHRTWLTRKAKEVQRAAEEFQRQGGVEGLSQVAQNATELLRKG